MIYFRCTILITGLLIHLQYLKIMLCFFFLLFFLRIVAGGVQTGSTRHRGHLLSYCACPGWLWGWRIIWWNEEWQGKSKYSEKTCTSATLSTTNPTWPDPGLKPGRRGGKSATNRLSYGAACYAFYLRLEDTGYNVDLRGSATEDPTWVISLYSLICPAPKYSS
jgi:hypothetical protein